MRFKLFLKSLWGYAGIILMFTFISNFVDANLGTTLLFVFCCLICLSIILLIIGVNITNIHCTKGEIVISKGQKAFLEVFVTSKLPIALCFNEIVMKKQQYIKEQNDKNVCFMVDSMNPAVFKIPYKGQVFGKDVVGVETLIFRDFLGLIEIKKYIKEDSLAIITLPIYKEMAYDKSLMLLTSYNTDFDDSEETNGSVTTQNGYPGYEHREYIEGDSPKRINYKLSAKKNKLLVRLDEPVASMRQAVILDCISSKDRYKDEIALEGLLAYVGFLVNNTISTEVYLPTTEGVFTTTVSAFSDMEYIFDACKKVEFVPYMLKSNIVLSRMDRISSVMIFTPGENSPITQNNYGASTFIVTAKEGQLAQNEFYINANLEILQGGEVNGEI